GGVPDVADRGALEVRLRVVVRARFEVGEVGAGDVAQTVVADHVRQPGPHDCRLEAGGLTHDPGGHVAAPAPAADAQPLRIGDATLDQVVDPGHDVPVLAATDITEERVRVLRTAAGAAARVGHEDGVASPGQGMRPLVPRGGELVGPKPGRPAVDLHHQRVPPALLIADGL